MADALSRPTNTRVAVVTGGNKGIGLEVCRQLASNVTTAHGGRHFQSPKHEDRCCHRREQGIGLEVCRQLASNGITVILTARDEKRGLEAAEKLKEAGLSDVIFHQLDVTDALSIAWLANFLKTRCGKLDILVNNAAVGEVEYVQDPVAVSETSEEKFSGMELAKRLEWMWQNSRETYDAAKEGLQTNYYGTKHVTEALLPLLQASDDGRIVNVSSEWGRLKLFNNEELKQELNDVENLTEERLDEVLGKFLKYYEAGALESQGWPIAFSAYKVAKAVMNVYSRFLARKHPELRASRIRQDRHNHELWCPVAGGRRGQCDEGGTAARRRTNRLVLRMGRGGAFRVILPRTGQGGRSPLWAVESSTACWQRANLNNLTR